MKLKTIEKVERPEVGEYVLVSQKPDHKPTDPWCIGIIEKTWKRPDGMRYRIEAVKDTWRHAFRISVKEAMEYFEKYKDVCNQYTPNF